MPRKVKFEECWGPGLLVNLYALMEAEGTRPGLPGIFFSGWERETTVEGRGGMPWVFFRVPYREPKPGETYRETEKRREAMAEQAKAARDWVTKKMRVPAVLWCTDWGMPGAPDAPPPKGKKIKPHKAFDRAVRELKRSIKADADYIKQTLDDVDVQAAELEEEGLDLEDWPGYVGCLDPTTGVVYEAGIEWPQYFQGCGGPGPWNMIISFHIDLEDPKEMLKAVSDAVGEAFEMAGVED